MKAMVITLSSVANYGTQLQAYATQEKMKQYFDEVELINYRRPDSYGMKLARTFTKGNILKLPAILPTMMRWKMIFGRFQKRYLKLSKKVYTFSEDFEKFQDNADLYFSGSDQVWNTGWNHGIIPPLYLSFIADDKPKYSFSSSFGKEEIEDEYIDECKKYLSRYNAISVREESGLRILRDQMGIKNGVRLVDPTLMFDADFWRNIAPKKSKIYGDYVLVYNLNRSKEFDNYCKEFSKKTGLKLYRFCTRYDQIFRSGKSIVIPDILDFVTLIDNAKYVVTDSFHATAFSINMGTEPVCIYPNEYSNRLSEFLKMVGAEGRHVKGYDDFDVINRKVDFKKVQQVLETERKKADDFLKDVTRRV